MILQKRENNGTEKIGLVTPTPGLLMHTHASLGLHMMLTPEISTTDDRLAPIHHHGIISHDVRCTKLKCFTSLYLLKVNLNNMRRFIDNALQWRHNEGDGISHHRRLQCLLNCWFRRTSKNTSKLRVSGLCAGNSSVTSEFPAQKTSNSEYISIWWRHHGTVENENEFI